MFCGIFLWYRVKLKEKKIRSAERPPCPMTVRDVESHLLFFPFLPPFLACD
jgi:hypothetical protein